MEWIKHSNKSNQCDICNTKYKFRTIYDPSMPPRIPVTWILGRALQHGSRAMLRLMSVVFYVVFVVVYVPVHWKFVGRCINWIIDGRLPLNNDNLLDALLFGTTKVSAGTVPSMVKQFAISTYASGLRHIFIFVVVHVAIFVEHEWVVRDDGYIKMLTRRVGKEPKARLADMFQNALNGLRQERDVGEVEDRIDLLAAAINELNDPRRWPGDVEVRMGEGDGEDEGAEEAEREREEREEEEEMAGALLDAQLDAQLGGMGGQDAAEAPEAPEAAAAAQDAPAAPAPAPNDFQNIANDIDDQDDNIFTLLGLKLDLQTPLVVMILCNLITTIYLSVLYLIPSIIGTFMIQISGSLLQFLHIVINRNINLNWSLDLPSNWNLPGSLGIFTSYIIYSTKSLMVSAYNGTFTDQPTAFGRTVTLLMGYTVIAALVAKLMKTLEGFAKPLLGNQRKLYSILFEVVCTLKVFFIFAIEIFFFPLYCGWLLDFCFAPILLDKFIIPGKPVQFMVMFTQSSPYFSIPYIQVAMYWASGTLYMLLFALFVGMIRSKILRRGVLFFIRSPDDPNARLIHDALVKPLGLQLSRIFLSAKVYSGFILVGIGAVNWGLRVLTDPDLTDSSKNILFPVTYIQIYDILAVCFTVLALIRNKQPIIKYVTLYWKFAFEVSCHKLRLSHFILGKPIAEERGYVVYKSVWDQLAGAVPDYTSPVTNSEAQRLFSTTNIVCCFVPNGNYIRVPDNDTISRSYVKKLFANVTKDDQLLDSYIPVITPDDVSDSDQDYTADNNYTVVYKPPALKWRCLQLILLLWVFAVVLIASVFFVGLGIGRPVTKAFALVHGAIGWFVSSSPVKMAPFVQDFIDTNFVWHLADARSICYGILAQLAVLLSYERRVTQDPAPANINAFVMNENFNAADEYTAKKLLIVSKGLSIIWTSFVHIFVVDLSYKLLGGAGGANGATAALDYRAMAVDLPAVLLHLLAVPFTVYPSFDVAFIGRIQAMGAFDWWRVAHTVDLVNNIVKAALVVVTIPLIGTVWSAVVFWVYAAVYTAFRVAVQVRQYGEEIKNERYVRGRALQNVE